MERWSAGKANEWWNGQPWAVGANYVTSDAVNDVEMWMNDTFNPGLIQTELERAHDIGFNSVRVFLSYTVWKNEKELFEQNFERFLEISRGCGISVMPVLFDDCAFDRGSDPVYGKQPDPVPGVHNSRWVPSPGFEVQDSPEALSGCREYVSDVIGSHRDDKRIIAWDLFNEPGNTNRLNRCFPLLKKAFEWGRAEEPVQPITAAAWLYDSRFDEINNYLAENSDIISLHSYSGIESVKNLIERYEKYGRPIFVTEWFNRKSGSTYENNLPLFSEKRIGIWQWGIVAGKTQTYLSWSAAENGSSDMKKMTWQHDILYPDLTPYSENEIALLKSYTNRNS